NSSIWVSSTLSNSTCPNVIGVNTTLGYAAGGEAITIYGTGFLANVDHNATKCRFNHTIIVDVTQWISSTAIVCVTPAFSSNAVVALDVIYNGVLFTASSLNFTYYGK